MIFTVDKNLFLYDLAVVAILKNEGAYLKEWLDYHLLAGVDHFYLYDNDSTDNQAAVAEPYIAAGLVDYIPAPGKMMQMVAYNDAVKRFKFQCRYMAFIDADEFIFPKTNQSIVELVDEILSYDTNAAGLAINLQAFGSNGHEKADYSRGVLERFTRRAYNHHYYDFNCKTIFNPRKVDFIYSPHVAQFFAGLHTIYTDGVIQTEKSGLASNLDNKIVVNHYHYKSREEYAEKVKRGSAARAVNHKKMERFEDWNVNEIFDDGILKYRDARAENFSLEDDEHRLYRVIDALTKTLNAYAENTPPADKLETALTCRALSSYLREKFPDIERMKLYEEVSLTAVINSLDKVQFWEERLLISELPDILNLPHPAVKDLRDACRKLLLEFMEFMKLNYGWNYYAEFDYLQRLLKTWH